MAFFHGFVDPAEQAWMLLDENRVKLFRKAIMETVNAGDVVVDIEAAQGFLPCLRRRLEPKKSMPLNALEWLNCYKKT